MGELSISKLTNFFPAVPRLSAKSTNLGIGGTVTRPRPQPIAGTPPPDPHEKCDQKIIQQTCSLFGLDLVSKNLVFDEIYLYQHYSCLTGTTAAGARLPLLHDKRELEAGLPAKSRHEDELPRGGSGRGTAAEEGRGSDRSGCIHRTRPLAGGAQGPELPRALPIHGAEWQCHCSWWNQPGGASGWPGNWR